MMLISAFVAAALAQQVPTSEFLETRQLAEDAEPTDKDTTEVQDKEPTDKDTTEVEDKEPWATATCATTANGSHVLEGEKVDCFIEATKQGKTVAFVDFDKTLSRKINPDGSKGKTSHNIIILPPDTQKAKDDDFTKYHAIEIDPDMTVEQKTPIMVEWYNRTNTHIITSGITEDQMIKDVKESPVMLREGVPEFFTKCKELGIPVVVVSAGLGDVANLVLKRDLPEDVEWEVVSNNLIWNKDTPKKIIGVSKPLIHMFNKSWAGVSEAIRKKYKLYEKSNALVVGDSNGDATIAHGSKFGSLKIGFLNDNLEKKTPQYNCLFDRVLYGGGAEGESFLPIVEMLGKVAGATENPKLLEKPVCKAPKAHPMWDDTERVCTSNDEKVCESNYEFLTLLLSNAGSLTPLLLLSVFFLL